jgi:CHAD domain-containing protein
VRELELKFAVHEPFTIPDVAVDGAVASVNAQPKVELRATYYDTEDLRLAREGITLRRRTGGDDAGWHLKLPLAGDHPGARDEIARPLGGRGVPADLRELVTAFVRGARLEPVATLRTARDTYQLVDPTGSVVALLVDDSVSVLDGDRTIERFRELEVESTGADVATLEAVGALLVDAGAVAGSFMPKAVRALGSRATTPPDPPPPAVVTRRSSAGEVVTAFLQTHVRALLTRDPLVRQGAPDSVHQMRVAARRLRSGLKTFGPLVDETWATATRTELAWLASSLGAARDTEVLLERFERQLAAVPDDVLRARALAVVRARLGEQIAAAGDETLAALSSRRYVRLLDSLVASAVQPPLTDAAAERADCALPPLAAKAWSRLAKAVSRIDDSTPDEDLHRARIIAKQARYASEACALALGKPAKRLAVEITKVQDVLGEHQDAAVATTLLADLLRTSNARSVRDTGLSFGMLYAMQLHAATAARQSLPAVWADVDRRRLRRWLER